MPDVRFQSLVCVEFSKQRRINSLRLPEFDIVDPQKWRETWFLNPHILGVHIRILNLIQEVEVIFISFSLFIVLPLQVQKLLVLKIQRVSIVQLVLPLPLLHLLSVRNDV